MNEKTKKIITIISISLASTVFVISALFNIFMFKTSYGTLMFNYNKETYFTMHSIASEKFDVSLLNKQTKYSTKISGENIEGCDYFTTQYYVDKNSKLNIKTTCKINKETTTYYFKDSTLYVEKGSSKTSESIDFDNYVTQYPEFFGFASGFLFDPQLTDSNNKTSIDFSFSPFYTFGIKYSYSKSDIKYTYHYNLKGHLRKIDIKKDGKVDTLKIFYNEKIFKTPSFN